MMIRVIAIIVGALALAACSSTSSWMDSLKPAPQVDNVRFESEPPGAEAKASNGQTCRTPCSLALPVDTPLTVNFTLTGYEPATETLEPLELTGSPTTLRPNPVMVELTALPEPAKKPTRKRAKKPAAKKPVAKKPAAKPAAKSTPAAAPSAPPPMQSAPQQAPAPAPWPATPPPQQQ
jgi:hypothetical protein